MSKKIIGVTVGTPMDLQAMLEKTKQAEQIAKNTNDIIQLSSEIDNLKGGIAEVAELVGGDA